MDLTVFWILILEFNPNNSNKKVKNIPRELSLTKLLA